MSSAVSYAVWGAIAVGAIALWASSRQVGASTARPTIVLHRLAQEPVTRVLLLLGWAWLGWHAFAR